MKMYKYMLLLVFFSLLSCQSSKQPETVSVHALQHKVLLDDDFVIGSVRSMVLVNDSTPVVIDMQSGHIFRVLDHAAQAVRDYGRKGQGPDDFLFPAALSAWKDGAWGCWDVSKRRYSVMRILPGDSVVQAVHLFEDCDSLFHYEVFPVCNNRFIAVGMYENYRLTQLDKQGRLVKGFGVSPYRDEEERKVPGTIRSDVYQGKLAVNPSGTWLVHASLRADILSFYDIRPDGELSLVTERVGSYPDYDRNTGAMDVSALIYYLDVSLTGQYAYVLYSGRNYKDDKNKTFMGNLIQVYDKEGRHVKNLKLDIDIQHLCVSSDDTKIYAIALLPNPVLVSFDL